MAEGTDKPAPKQEEEARKRRRRSASHERMRRSKALTRRELGEEPVWDWLQLRVLPLSLALIGFWLTMQHIRHQRTQNQRAASERAMEELRAEQAAVQACLDQMGMLLLDGDLRHANENCDERRMARARTLRCLDQYKRLRSVRFPRLTIACCTGSQLIGRPNCDSLPDPIVVSPELACSDVTHAILLFGPLRMGFFPFVEEPFPFRHLYVPVSAR